MAKRLVGLSVRIIPTTRPITLTEADFDVKVMLAWDDGGSGEFSIKQYLTTQQLTALSNFLNNILNITETRAL